MNKNVNDSLDRKELKNKLNGRNILLICPGSTIKTHEKEIDMYISEYSPVIISLNFISSSFNADFAFISNSIRYSQITGVYADTENKPQIMITSNITPSPALPHDFVFNFKTLHDEINGDVCAALLLNLLLSLGFKKITFAGFDGFDGSNKSFFDSGYTLTFDNQSYDKTEFELKNIAARYNCSDIKFITPSKFERILNNGN